MKKRSNKRKQKEYILDVTHEDYEADIAGGMAPADTMKPGKHVFRRVDPKRLAKPEDLERQNIKLIITARIDADVVDFFKRRAGKPGASGYQTQINDALRAFMEQQVSGGDYATLLEDDKFIEAVAAKVRAQEASVPDSTRRNPQARRRFRLED
jgi:uncharacterized protein (DUF4415 family)